MGVFRGGEVPLKNLAITRPTGERTLARAARNNISNDRTAIDEHRMHRNRPELFWNQQKIHAHHLAAS